MLLKRAGELKAFRISPRDTNYFACLLDPIADGAAFTWVVEIFTPGGATPPNVHQKAQEAFFVLAGRGVARAGDTAAEIGPGEVWVTHGREEALVHELGKRQIAARALRLVGREEDAE